MKQRVFVSGSLWSLLIYLLINDVDTCKKTRYFFTPKGIHPSVRKNFPGHAVLDTSITRKWHWRIAQLAYIFIPYINRLKWPFLINADIWGIDQEFEIQSIIGRNNYTLIEDGLKDYIIDRHVKNDFKSALRSFLWGPCYLRDFGRNSHCKRILLTKNFDQSKYENKAERIFLNCLWNEASIEKKEYILNCFNLTLDELGEIASKKVILLTQPIAEDCNIPQEEAINIYRELIRPYGEENVLIKPHPREKTDYKWHFQKAKVIDKIFPFQLFNLVGLDFNTALTICSTSVSELNGKNTKIVFLGSDIDSRISDVYGNVSISDLK